MEVEKEEAGAEKEDGKKKKSGVFKPPQSGQPREEAKGFLSSST
jgi:hypothetical protein